MERRSGQPELQSPESTGPLGVYVHFPFCRRICPYCDFSVDGRRAIPHRAYAEAVVRELESRRTLFPGRPASTLYFGGGTPSEWEPERVAQIVDAVGARLGLHAGAEVTLEANPEELGDGRLGALRQAGINRLSLGAQSFDDGFLAALGRRHLGRDVALAVQAARRAGIENVSIDLMAALPGQSEAQVLDDVDRALALDPEHVSLYLLTIEERTPFGRASRQGRLARVDPGQAASIYEAVRGRLAAAGLVQYEISNWARPGRHAVHNALYWSGADYLGLGCSAHSHRRLGVLAGDGWQAERFSNVRGANAYLRLGAASQPRTGADGALEDDPLIAEREQLDRDATEAEALWLGLRRIDGVDLTCHAEAHGAARLGRHRSAIAELERHGLVLVERTAGGERLRLSDRGLLLADEVGARILDAG